MSEEQPAARPLRRLAVRSVGLGLLTAAAVAIGFLIADLARRSHEDSYPSFEQFTGWQMYLAAAGVAVVALGLGGAAAALAEPRRFLTEQPPKHSQVFWALFAIALGTLVGGVTNTGTLRLLDWAARHTTSARAAHATQQRILAALHGDAEHPPRYPQLSPTAPPALTGPLLRASDLGPDWHLDSPPTARTSPRTPGTVTTGQVSLATVVITQEKWNGQGWVGNHEIFEFVRRYASHRLASERATRSGTQLAGHQVWLTRYEPRSGGTGRIVAVVGPFVIWVSVQHAQLAFPAAGPTPSFQPTPLRDIARAAVRRAELALG